MKTLQSLIKFYKRHPLLHLWKISLLLQHYLRRHIHCSGFSCIFKILSVVLLFPFSESSMSTKTANRRFRQIKKSFKNVANIWMSATQFYQAPINIFHFSKRIYKTWIPHRSFLHLWCWDISSVVTLLVTLSTICDVTLLHSTASIMSHDPPFTTSWNLLKFKVGCSDTSSNNIMQHFCFSFIVATSS